ncbi:MAG: hypothetical protein IPK19_20810 [Chloroflexi bacterium]|nr:hypothetical protein [Chloroflexota bacterium]
MDCSPFGTVIAEGVGKPILYMLSEEAIAASTTITDEALEAAGITREAFDAMLAEQLADRASLLESSPGAYQFVLSWPKHNTYSTDSGLARRPRAAAESEEMVGTIEPDRAVKVISDYVVAFFDQHVKAREAVRLFNGPGADYPEVTLEVL